MTSLKAKYEAFLASPSTGALADNASINYIPTLVTINEPTAILKHLSAQRKLLIKKSERVLSTIASSDGLCVDIDTTIEFIGGGGAFLPGLDDNFLSDKVVYFPVVSLAALEIKQQLEINVIDRSILSNSMPTLGFVRSAYTGTKARF